MKKCYKCLKYKDESLFYRNSSKFDGLASECKKCNNKMCSDRFKSKTALVVKSIKKNEERIKEYYKENPWKIMYKRVKDRTSNENHHYFKLGVKNKITPEEIKIIFCRDNGFGMERPSLDRINPNGDYEFSNCRVIELRDNIRGKRRKKWEALQEQNNS